MGEETIPRSLVKNVMNHSVEHMLGSLIGYRSTLELLALRHCRKVMFDADLANLYGVTTKRLNEQVRRNFDRFPKDFMFQFDENELVTMRSQIATASKRNIRFLPYVFLGYLFV